MATIFENWSKSEPIFSRLRKQEDDMEDIAYIGISYLKRMIQRQNTFRMEIV